jgi:ATP-dependent Lon protease
MALHALNDAVPLLFPPILLDGPPGVGKTSFAEALAQALRAPLIRFNLAQATSGFAMAGTDPQFASGGPGYLVRALVELCVPDAVVLIDEIDKVPADATHSATGPLYALMERSSAACFTDEGFRMPLNLAHLRLICTSNDARMVEAPLQSRCVLYRIPPPTRDEMREIVRREYVALLQVNGWGCYFQQTLDDVVLDALCSSGPRAMKALLWEALGSAAMDNRRSVQVGDIPRREQQACMGFTR